MIGNKRECFEWLSNQPDTRKDGKAKLFKINEYRAKRSLNANAYAWLLICRIADELKTSKGEIYLQMLEDYGQSVIVPVQQGIKVDGIFKYCKYIKTQDLNGQSADFYKIMKGSSNFDTKEMSVFIDGIVSEAKDLDIETIPVEEINRLKEMWYGKDEKEEQSEASKEEEEKEE